MKRLPAEGGVFVVVIGGEFPSDAMRVRQERVEMGATGRGNDAFGPEKEGEALQGGLIAGELRRVEALVGKQVVPLVEEARLHHVGDDKPVDLQVDGVLQRLLDGRALTAPERAIERI